MNITTKWEKIYDEEIGQTVRKKVFMIRGDEAYAKTTDITLSYSTPVTGDVKGFKTTFTIKLYRNTGASKVLLYDGDELITMEDVADGVSTVTIEDVYLSYIAQHELYAVFKGNSSCLGSKSKRQTITVPLPSSLGTDITFNSIVTQIQEGASLGLNISASQSGVAVDDGTIINIYDNDTLIDSLETEDGAVSKTVTGLTKGKHTITASIDATSTMNASSNSYDVSVGYNVSIFDYTKLPIANDSTNFIDVRVYDYHGNAINSGSVTISGIGSKTVSNGKAKFTYSNLTDGNYSATYSNSSSETISLYVFTPTNLSIRARGYYDASTCAYNSKIPIEVSVTGIYNGTGVIYNGLIPQPVQIPIKLTGGINTTLTPVLGTTGAMAMAEYVGVGAGTTRVTASIGNLTEYVDIEDCLAYYKPSSEANLDMIIKGGRGAFSKTGSGLLFASDTGGMLCFKTPTDNVATEIKFTVVEVSDASRMYFGKFNGQVSSITGLTANDEIKITYSTTTGYKWYRNGTQVNTSSILDAEKSDFAIGISGAGTGNMGQIKVTNLTIK